MNVDVEIDAHLYLLISTVNVIFVYLDYQRFDSRLNIVLLYECMLLSLVSYFYHSSPVHLYSKPTTACDDGMFRRSIKVFDLLIIYRLDSELTFDVCRRFLCIQLLCLNLFTLWSLKFNYKKDFYLRDVSSFISSHCLPVYDRYC